MQLTFKFIALTGVALSMITFGVTATPTGPFAQKGTDSVDTVVPGSDAAAEPFHIMTPEEMAHWLANTDAELTYIGEPINPLTPRSALVTTVTYCTTGVGTHCGGPCYVYSGVGARCLYTPNTYCLSATNDVAFCTSVNCDNPCSLLSACQNPIANGFCIAPATNSISTPV